MLLCLEPRQRRIALMYARSPAKASALRSPMTSRPGMHYYRRDEAVPKAPRAHRATLVRAGAQREAPG
jgi:hypothetical protein